MARPVSSIRNLGPASDAAFARAGLTNAEAVIALGAEAAYARLLAAGSRPHFIAFYALAMGLQGRPWNDCQGEEKAELRAGFDRIVAAAETAPNRSKGPPPGIEAALDALGVRDG
ncbi:MAG: TfoX/Sxy family DNA transformation protein [Pseudomonadota bacterium]